MSSGDLNIGLVRRITTLAQAHLSDGVITEAALDGIFEMVRADEVHRAAVRRGLKGIGVTVTATARPTADDGANRLPPTATTSVPEPRRARSVETLSAEQSSDRSTAAARALLETDQRTSRPLPKRLLTAEEEVGLALLMRAGSLPLDEQLPQGFRTGLDRNDERARAFDAFVLHNLGLVRKVALAVRSQRLELDDLMQAGFFGLLRSVEMFDGSRGLKFSTYAMNWIKQQIGRAIDNEDHLIRIPVHVWEDIRKVEGVRARLSAAGRSSSLFDMSAETGFTPQRVVELLRLRAGVVSLDMLVGEDRVTPLGEMLAEEFPLADPEDVLLGSVFRAEIRASVEQLPEREAQIILRRMGFDDAPMTLDDIGQDFGVTRERIRQLELKAKKKLGPMLRRRGVSHDWGARACEPA